MLNQTHVRKACKLDKKKDKSVPSLTIGWHFYQKSLNKYFVNMLQIDSSTFIVFSNLRNEVYLGIILEHLMINNPINRSN